MKELAAAMAKAFPEIEGATKDSENPAFKQGGKALKYADLSSVVEAVKPALAKHDLWFSQMTHEHEGGVCVETVLTHSSGESMSFGKLFVPASKQDAQGYGSALTYARRYSLMTAFGVAPEDDDGNAAGASVAQKSPPREVPVLVTPEQEMVLGDAIRNTGSDLKKFLEWAGFKTLRDIPRTDFDKALAAINAKKKPKPEPEPAIVDDEIPY